MFPVGGKEGGDSRAQSTREHARTHLRWVFVNVDGNGWISADRDSCPVLDEMNCQTSESAENWAMPL